MSFSQSSSNLNIENKHKLRKTSIIENKAFKFENPLILPSRKTYDDADLPIDFKVSPESLWHLAAKVVDALPLPAVFHWSSEDVCKWLCRCGYQQYENTFHVNMITGRKLLLIDATALCAMNIKHFDDIKHITLKIRKLFNFEMTNFMRSISLPPQHHFELYNLFQTKSGYEHMSRSKLWFQWRILGEKPKYLRHWEVLERWLLRVGKPTYAELCGPLM